MIDSKFVRYIPKEYRELVENVREGERVWNEITKRWNTYLVVEWKNGEVSTFQNKAYARGILEDFHSPEEYK